MLPKNAKKIPGFPGYYATPDGDIWSGPRKQSPRCNKLKPQVSTDNHRLVGLCKAGRMFTKLVHRLILETFVGPCPEGMESCHYNDVPFDNRLENLRWDTRSNNQKDAFRNGRQCNKGECNSNAKLNRPQVRIIKHLLKFPTEFTQRKIGEIFGVRPITISNIACGTCWKGV